MNHQEKSLPFQEQQEADCSLPKVLMQNAAVALAYLLTAKLGFLLALAQTNATAVWPPTGIALGLCLVFGSRLWPGIFAGALCANVALLGSSPFSWMPVLLTSLGTATGNTLEAIVGARLVRRFLTGGLPFTRTLDAISFILLGALLSPVLSASIGTASFSLLSGHWSGAGQMWLTWWIGDAVGALVFAPLLLTWKRRAACGWHKKKAVEAALLVMLLVAVEVIVFPLGAPLEYLFFPCLFWTALRFGPFESALTVALVMLSSILWTIKGMGPFAGTTLNQSLLFLQSYLGVATGSTLLLSTLTSARNNAEEALRGSEEKYRNIFENAPVGIFHSETGGRFSSVNESLARMFGYESPAAMVTQISDIAGQLFVFPEQRQLIIDKTRASEKFVREEVVYRRRDGSEFVAILYMRMLQSVSGAATRLEGFVEDITERKQAEKSLREYQNNLEESVKVRTAELQAALDDLAVAKERAEDSDRLKSAFLATMSHELRTPLNSIIGFTGILLQELGGPVNDEQRKQLTMVKNSANHLLSLIKDILDISKIEAGRLSVSHEQFDVRELLLSTIDGVRPLVEKKGLLLNVELAPDLGKVWADQRRLEQVMANLLSNAVKFTDHGTITVGCQRETADLKFSVSDTGIGISNDQLGRLFEPFHQVDTGLSRKYEGTGLGLSISKRLVELMRGRMMVESCLGKGSAFSFTLPLERGQE